MSTVTAVRQAPVEPVKFERSTEGFHEWLQGELKARNMSQRQLAQKSGVDHSSISRVIRGERMPSLRTAMRLARGVDHNDEDPSDFRHGTSNDSNPLARVEYALRADDQLTEADVREIMLYYLSTRGEPMRRAAEASSRMPSQAPEATVERAAGAGQPPGGIDRRQSPRG